MRVMMDDLTNQRQVTYYFPGANSITIPNPIGVKVVAKDGNLYHVISKLDGNTVIMAPHWLAIEMVPSTQQEIIH